MNYPNKILSWHFALLAFFAPISSVLLVPGVQGTTPGYLLSYLSIPVALILGDKKQRIVFLKLIIWCIIIWAVFFICSQFFLILDVKKIFYTNLILIDPSDRSDIFRSSTFTQTAYLFAVVSYVAFVYTFYEKSWGRYLKYGAIFLAVYGFYEVIYFLVTQENGDFVSNRTFGEDMDTIGSSFQTMVVAGLGFMRLKSLTGEPSMFAFTMMPLVYFSFADNWGRKTKWILILSVVLSASTTALLSCFVGLGVMAIRGKIRAKWFAWCGAILLLVAFVFNEFVSDLIDQLVVAKAMGENFSGSDRSSTFINAVDFWMGLGFFQKVFGVGFGVIRSTDFLATALVNLGILGLACFAIIFIMPIVRLPNRGNGLWLQVILASTLAAMLASVPEFSYLTPWTFVAIAYRPDSLREGNRDILESVRHVGGGGRVLLHSDLP